MQPWFSERLRYHMCLAVWLDICTFPKLTKTLAQPGYAQHALNEIKAGGKRTSKKEERTVSQSIISRIRVQTTR